jgi:mRNA-degrading endonuclease RelE of RelBE toxin-antitoxin system
MHGASVIFSMTASPHLPMYGNQARSTLGNLWRYRVGDYRIICDLQDEVLVVLVVEIGHRREVYR